MSVPGWTKVVRVPPRGPGASYGLDTKISITDIPGEPGTPCPLPRVYRCKYGHRVLVGDPHRWLAAPPWLHDGTSAYVDVWGGYRLKFTWKGSVEGHHTDHVVDIKRSAHCASLVRIRGDHPLNAPWTSRAALDVAGAAHGFAWCGAPLETPRRWNGLTYLDAHPEVQEALVATILLGGPLAALELVRAQPGLAGTNLAAWLEGDPPGQHTWSHPEPAWDPAYLAQIR